MKTARDVQLHNLREFMENGPGLRTTTRTCIVAKGSGKVLIYGLGGVGIGQMVFTETEDHRKRPEYAEAPTVDDPEMWWFDPFSLALSRL